MLLFTIGDTPVLQQASKERHRNISRQRLASGISCVLPFNCSFNVIKVTTWLLLKYTTNVDRSAVEKVAQSAVDKSGPKWPRQKCSRQNWPDVH